MGFLADHWGDLSSVAGVIVSLIGLTWAVVAARDARSAAQAAEEATNETKDSIGRHLLAIELERAINLIQRLKLLHSASRLEASLEQYQALRAMISAIVARYPKDESGFRERLSNARESISAMEEYVEARVRQGLKADDVIVLNQQLNALQSVLEDMSSAIDIGG